MLDDLSNSGSTCRIYLPLNILKVACLGNVCLFVNLFSIIYEMMIMNSRDRFFFFLKIVHYIQMCFVLKL